MKRSVNAPEWSPMLAVFGESMIVKCWAYQLVTYLRIWHSTFTLLMLYISFLVYCSIISRCSKNKVVDKWERNISNFRFFLFFYFFPTILVFLARNPLHFSKKICVVRTISLSSLFFFVIFSEKFSSTKHDKSKEKW